MLTLKRARFYALITMVFGVASVVIALNEHPERLTASVDFPAFYNAGKILNQYPIGSLYDPDLQHRLFIELAPTAAGTNGSLFFAYTPFFAVLFKPLAFLPYPIAFACWAIASLILFTFGFGLIWKTAGLPEEHRTDCYLIALSFLPMYAWCLLAGQTTAFGFFCLAFTIYLHKERRDVAAGLALSLLLYKPPLLLLIIPMLMLTRAWRTLRGFALGSFVLGILSLLLIGLNGVPGYMAMLSRFSSLKVAGHRQTWVEIDAFSFFLSLVHDRAIAIILFALLAAIALPLLAQTFKREHWAGIITWTIILNLYVLMYDSSLIIISILLTAGSLKAQPKAWRLLLVVLFIAPWFETWAAQSYGFQPVSLVMIVFGFYQLRLLYEDTRPLSSLVCAPGYPDNRA